MNKIFGFLAKNWVVFLIGAVVGIVFFGLFYGYNLVDPGNVSWIFTEFSHDTGQHQLGWEFFRAGSSGGRITTLALPGGIPITFLDSAPIFAFFWGIFREILPANFQYFGLFGLLTYALFGAFSALILKWIFVKVFDKFFAKKPEFSHGFRDQFFAIFILLGSIFLIVSPLLIARTFYHTALGSQWLILLGFSLNLFREKLFSEQIFAKIPIEKSQKILTKFIIFWRNFFAKISASSSAKFVGIWSLVLALTTLIHPYFLPMLGAILLVNSVLIFAKNRPHNFAKNVGQIVIPVAISGAIFWAIGGLSLGGEAGATDLFDKGFNLASFVFPGGYSAIFPFLTSDGARSGSPETMMWLGAGTWSLLISGFVLWRVNSRKNANKKGLKIRENLSEIRAKLSRKIHDFGRVKSWLIFAILLGLLIFSLSPSIQFAGFELVKYPVPAPILHLWEDFRAAAREAWPFYYFVQFFAIYFFAKEFLKLVFREKNVPKISRKSEKISTKKLQNFAKKTENYLTVFAGVFLLFAALQFADIYFSPNAQNRTENFAKFAKKTADYEFPLDLRGILNEQKNLINLDLTAAGDMKTLNILGQTATENDLTLNVGYFARIPDSVKNAQENWREKFAKNEVSADEISRNLFVTKDENFAKTLAENYEISTVREFYFVRAKK